MCDFCERSKVYYILHEYTFWNGLDGSGALEQLDTYDTDATYDTNMAGVLVFDVRVSLMALFLGGGNRNGIEWDMAC
jgi:hypothetical protein